MTDGAEEEGQHLIAVDYADDTERKRAEYLLDNWEDGSVEKVRGLTRIVRGVNVDELYDELVAKVPQEKIKIYELGRVDTEATEETATFADTFDDVPRERLEWAMESLMNKRKSVEMDSHDSEYRYAVYTKKGRARITYTIQERNNTTVALEVTIKGYGDAPEFLKEYIMDELPYMIT